MSSSFNIQNIIDTTFNELFNNNNNINLSNIYDICFNTLNTQEDVEVENNSIPDLIPLVNENNPPNPNPSSESSSHNELQMWTNLIEDYNGQINIYQQNIRSILQITEEMLIIRRQSSRRPRSMNNPTNNPMNNPMNNPTNNNTNNRRNLISQLRNWFQNSDYISNPQYVLEFENITPLFFSNTNTNNSSSISASPTSQEIQNATELFIYEPRNRLAYTTCPISLEEFREGEPLMRIYGCGHIFKAFELQRWFLRNTKCPSCRYDIRTSSIDPSYNNLSLIHI